jgi:hypothetical protein
VAVSKWCAKSPQPYLQAVFLFDEADIYLPAGNKQPATKAPMEDLLKRARSAGVAVFLATQSPGDFDYKCKENVRTWLIGRVKEPRAIEKLRPMLADAKGNVIGKLAGQAAGEFASSGSPAYRWCIRTSRLFAPSRCRRTRSRRWRAHALGIGARRHRTVSPSENSGTTGRPGARRERISSAPGAD